jgi:REP-associated tyrosine transposase
VKGDGWPTIAFSWQLWDSGDYTCAVPRGLYRSHHSGSPHFITFTCFHRYPHLSDPAVRDLFVRALERTRALYGIQVYAFVVMPEHVHLLISEPERGTVANAIQSLKISSAKRARKALAVTDSAIPFWQKRYYDRNEWNHKEFIEKRKYIHRNPVRRGLVGKPEDWNWSSYRHYSQGEECGVEIESWRNRTQTTNPTIAN